MVVAFGAWLALRPREVAPGVGDDEEAKRRRPDGDVHEVLSIVWQHGGLGLVWGCHQRFCCGDGQKVFAVDGAEKSVGQALRRRL